MSAAGARISRAVTSLICVGSLVHVTGLVPRFLRLGQGLSFSGFMLAVSLYVAVAACLGGCVMALILVARSWDRPGVPALAVFLASAAAVWGAILRLGNFQIGEGGIGGTGQGGAIDFVVLIGGITFSSAAFLRFSATFPAVLQLAHLPAARGRVVPLRLRALFLRPLPVWGLGLLWPLAAVAAFAGSVALSSDQSLDGIDALPAFLVFVAFPALAMGTGAQNLTTGFRRAPPDDQRTLLWLVVGVVVSAWMILLPLFFLPLLIRVDAVMGSNLAVVSWALASGVLVSSVAMAMFYTGGVDPALVLKRGTVLGIVGTAWIVLFAAAESFFSNWASMTLGVPEALVSVGVALAAAAAALPLRRLASPLVRRVDDVACRSNDHIGRAP